MPYVLFFLKTMWYTLGAVMICGLAVSLCRRIFVSMMGDGFGRGVVLATSIVGTPVHELGHALMCLLFGHRITAMSLWQPRSSDGNLGYVTHAYRRRNPYHILGNLFIGLGPIFSGLAVLSLALLLGFPDTLSAYVSTASRMAAGGEGTVTLFLEGLKILPGIVEELTVSGSVPLWMKIIALLVILSVSQHISLSPADVKGALTALPIYLSLVLILTAVCGLLVESAMDTVTGALTLFSAYLTVLFVIVLVTSLLQLAIALPVWLIRKLCGH
jgi:hypothetical protein